MGGKRFRFAAAAISLCVLAVGPIHAQTARSGAAASSQLQMQLQQLAAEKTRMDAEMSKLKKDLEDAHKELDSLKSAQKALDSRAKESAAALAQSQNQRNSTDEQLKQTKERMERLIGKFREMAQTLRDTEADRATAKQALSARDQQLNICVERNLALYKINDEVLTRLEKQGFWSHVAAAEPFTRLKRIEMENLVDDYKARADDQRVAPADMPPAKN